MAGISAAEKYAELEAKGEERPKCKCHGEAMGWRKRNARDGAWFCRAKENLQNRLWRQANPEKSRESRKKTQEKYRDAYLERKRIAGRALRDKRKSLGLCVACGEIAISQVLCFDCLGKRDFYNLTRSR